MISPDPPTTRRATAKIFRLPWKLKCKVKIRRAMWEKPEPERFPDAHV